MLSKTALYEPEILLQAKQLYAANHPQISPLVARLKAAADQALNQGPYAVTFKRHLPPSGDPHDYVSLRRYYWPNPHSADGFPWAEKDGETNPLINAYDRTPLGELTEAVKNLALYAYITGDEQHGARAVELLNIWFLNANTRMNPHMTYASFVPGREPFDGNGIINAVLLIKIVESIGLVWDSTYLSAGDKAALQQWFLAFREWLLGSPNGRSEQQADNNHGLWFDAQILSFSFFCDQPDFIKSYVSTHTLPRFAAQIEPDGRMPREIARTLGLHYMEYALNALIDLASYAQTAGLDLWHYAPEHGGGIREVVTFSLPYFLQPHSWPYQQIRPFHPSKCAAHFYRIARQTSLNGLREKAQQLSGLENISPHTLLVNGMWELRNG